MTFPQLTGNKTSGDPRSPTPTEYYFHHNTSVSLLTCRSRTQLLRPRLPGSVLEAGGINQTGKVLTQPSQDCFLSFKIVCLQISISIYSLLSSLCFFPSFSLPPPPRPFLLCLSSRYPPFGLLGLHPPWTPSFQSHWWLLFEGPCPTISCSKGPQDQVPTLVLDTGRTVTKALATLCTLVWLLPSVCAPVFDQV